MQTAISSSSERFRLVLRRPRAECEADDAAGEGGEFNVGVWCAEVGVEGSPSGRGCGYLRGSWESQKTTLEGCCVSIDSGGHVDSQ